MKMFTSKTLFGGLILLLIVTAISCGKNSSGVENILGFFAGVALLVYLIGYFSGKPNNSRYYTKADRQNDEMRGMVNVLFVVILAIIVLLLFGLSNLIC